MRYHKNENSDQYEAAAWGMHGAVIRHSWAVVVFTAALAALGGYVYFFHLEIRTDRARLTNQDLETNRRYQHYQEQFGGDSDFLVLVLSAGLPEVGDSLLPPADPARRAAMKNVAAAWADRLRARPDLFPRVTARIDPEEMAGMGLLYLPFDAFEKMVEGLHEYLPDIRTLVSTSSLDSLLASLDEALSSVEPPDAESGTDRRQLRLLLDAVERLFRSLRQTLDGAGQSDLLDLDFQASFGSFDADGFFFTDDGRLLTAYASVTDNPEQRNRYESVMTYAQTALDEALARDTTRVAGGLAGLPALEYVEIVTSQRDFTRGTIAALLAVSLLFVWGFRSVLRPALAALCLCFSIAITFGAAWLLVGHINMLAMVFAIILVALGIDFAIHFFTHYRQGLAEGLAPAEAIVRTYRNVGAALWMGGLTTAGAFLSAYFTEFIGLSELGIIAGAGLLICLLCMYFVFPALLHLIDTRFPYAGGPGQRVRGSFLPGMIRVEGDVGGMEKMFLVIALALAGCGYGFGQYGFDANLLNLQPVAGAAGFWQRVLLASDDRTSFAIQTFADRASLERMREAVEASPLVRRTESVFPSKEERRRALLAPVCSTFTDVDVAPVHAASPGDIRRQLFRMRQTIRQFQGTSPEAEKALAGLASEVETAFRLLRELPEEESAARLMRFQLALRSTLLDAVGSGRRFVCPPPFELGDAPPALKSRFVGADGSFALMIYPALNTWEGPHLTTFVDALRTIDPHVFGGVINFYENSRSMIKSFIDAATYSFVAILILLLAWTRSIEATVLALAPLVASTGLLLGILAWMPKPVLWNFANFFSVPILIGIGVAGGIHLVKAWQMPSWTTFRDALRAVLYSALTTMIGFGILASSEHLGVASLGLILFIGITCNLLACLTVLPLLLRMRDPKEKENLESS